MHLIGVVIAAFRIGCYVVYVLWYCVSLFFFFQAEDGIRDLVRSRGLGDVYKRQVPLVLTQPDRPAGRGMSMQASPVKQLALKQSLPVSQPACLLYTSDAADERSSVDLGGRRIIKKKKQRKKYFLLAVF